MKIAVLIAKALAGVVGGVLLIGLVYVGLVMLRKSNRFVLRSDLETLAASGPYNSKELATAVCGTPVDALGAANTADPMTALPSAKLLSWRLLFPMAGTASARITGVGVDSTSSKAITGVCEATMTFVYRCNWADNGRAVVLEKSFVEPPTITRDR